MKEPYKNKIAIAGSSAFKEHWGLECILALSFLLSVFRLQDCLMTIDDYFSMLLARMPLSRIWDLGAVHPNGFFFNRYPPLYESILHFFMAPGPDILERLRLISIVINLAALVFIFKIARLFFEKKTALAAVLLCSLSYAYWFYPRMIRCYPLLNLLTVISLYSFFRSVWIPGKEGGKMSFLSLNAVNTAVLYTHYFGGFVILAEIALAIFSFSGRRRFKTVFALSLPFLFFIPWWRHLRYDLLTEPALSTGLRGWWNFAYVFFDRFRGGIFNSTLTCVVYSSIVAVMFAKGFYYVVRRREHGGLFCFLSAFVIMPAAMINFITRDVPDIYRARYFFPFVFPVFLLAAAFMESLPKTARRIFFSVIVILSMAVILKSSAASANKLWPAPVPYLTGLIRQAGIPESDRVTVEIEDGIFLVPVLYYLGDYDGFIRMLGELRRKSSGGKPDDLRLTYGRYDIYYNSAGNPMRHFTRSVPAAAGSDWLILLYSNWFDKYWGMFFRDIYQNKLSEYNMDSRLKQCFKAFDNNFYLEIYKVLKE